MLFSILSLFIFSSAQDIPITPDMYEYSPNSITGVYVCTPIHVKNGDCKDVDEAYYKSIAILNLGLYEIGYLKAKGRKALAFKGPLSPGSAENVIRILEKYPEIDTLILSSQGGSEEEASKIASVVRERNLKTWVPVQRMCLSACSAIFLSGSEMILDGILGLHSGTFHALDMYQFKDIDTAQTTINQATFEAEYYLMKRVHLYSAIGISLGVIDAMIEAKGDFLFFKSMKDLFEFDPKKNYVLPVSDALQYVRNQDISDFGFESYKQLF